MHARPADGGEADTAKTHRTSRETHLPSPWGEGGEHANSGPEAMTARAHTFFRPALPRQVVDGGVTLPTVGRVTVSLRTQDTCTALDGCAWRRRPSLPYWTGPHSGWRAPLASRDSLPADLSYAHGEASCCGAFMESHSREAMCQGKNVVVTSGLSCRRRRVLSKSPLYHMCPLCHLDRNWNCEEINLDRNWLGSKSVPIGTDRPQLH